MFNYPLAQLRLATTASELAMASASSTMANSASIMRDTFGAVADAYGKGKAKPVAKKTTTRRKEKISTPTYLRPALANEMIDIAFSPMRATFGVLSAPAAKKAEPTWPTPPWMAANPFIAKSMPVPPFAPITPMNFMKFMPTSSNVAPFGNAFVPKPPMAAVSDMFAKSMQAPFANAPWMQFFGMKPERSAFQKMADPFDVGSNVIPFPSMAMKNQSMPAMPSLMSSPNFEPAKIAAGMAAMVMSSQYLQSANSAAPWSFFGS